MTLDLNFLNTYT